MYNIKQTSTKIKTLKRGDKGFVISTDGFTVTPRAGFQINQQCPREYRLILQECINNGWIIPIAHVPESDYMWSELKNENIA